MQGPNPKMLLQKLHGIFPVLKNEGRKGANGRIAVIGGSYEFTGAPYYSAISALKVGGDLAHIFCSKSSSSAIKSYSPEIIVHPVFVSQEEHDYPSLELPAMYAEWAQKIQTWKNAINSWVIGPGLGRDKYMFQFFPQLVRGLPEGCVVIFDADGIYYLCQHPQLFEELKRFKTILTPNWKELLLLEPHIKGLDFHALLKQGKNQAEVQEITNSFTRPHFTLLIKGHVDIIIGERSFLVRTEGGNKRCGGIGDILAGVTAACAFWNPVLGPALAARIVKIATRRAFQKEGRGSTAPSIISELSKVVKEIDEDFRSPLRDEHGSL